jgi:predicted MFS family arabinose efflux permease
MSDLSYAADAASPPIALDDERKEAAWPAVIALTLGVFGLVTAEFLPASLLTPIAADLGISNGSAGQAVTATALVAAVSGPAIVIGAGRVDRRLVVFALTTLLILSNLLAAIATNIWILLAARVALGTALGAFWSLAAALALRLVPARMMPRAMAIIFTGVSAATVCAAPIGAYLGDLWGWRAPFLVASSIGIVALLTQILTLPRLPAVDAPGLATFVLLLRRPKIRLALITVMFVISGHFAGFTYIRPFLEHVTRLDVRMVSLALLAFGLGGFAGNLVGGVIAERSSQLASGLSSILLSAAALALLIYGLSSSVAFSATAVWGFAFAAFPVGIQTWTTQAAPDHAESGGALLVTTFQVAIATGAILGGLLVDRLGAPGAVGYCGFAVLIGGIGMLALGRTRAA